MKYVDLNLLIKQIEETIYVNEITIDDIIISSNDFYLRKTFTSAGNELHELRSLSKYIVSLCFGCLLDEKNNNKIFNLNTPIWPVLLPKVSNYNVTIDNFINSISVKNLLIQSAGYSNSKLLMSEYTTLDSEKYLEYLANEPIEYIPGSRFVYSNAAYFLLSAFFQELYGESIHAYAQKYIFNPLNIENSQWLCYGSYCAGATGLKMRSEDFHKIACLAINSGKYKNKQIISLSYIKEMLSGKIDVPNDYKTEVFLPKQYGYSFWCENNSIKYISGANGQYLILKEFPQICITILSNSQSISPVLKIIKDWLK